MSSVIYLCPAEEDSEATEQKEAELYAKHFDLATDSAPYTVTLRFGQLSPNVPPCSLKVMRFHTAIMVSSGTLKWNSSTLAKELKAFSLRGVRVKYSVTKRQSAENRARRKGSLNISQDKKQDIFSFRKMKAPSTAHMSNKTRVYGKFPFEQNANISMLTL